MSHNKLDLTGEVFGRLVAERDSGERYATDSRGKAGAVLWLCHCDPAHGGCGAMVLVPTHNLRSGNTTSCGCLHVDLSTAGSRKRRRLPPARAVRVDGESMLARRTDAGVSQQTLGEVCGIAPNAVHFYESGKNRHAHPLTVARIAAALGCRPDELTLPETTDPKRARPEGDE